MELDFSRYTIEIYRKREEVLMLWRFNTYTGTSLGHVEDFC